MPDTLRGQSDGKVAVLRRAGEILPDPLLVALGYLSAFEGGPLRPERDFIVGYLLGMKARQPDPRAA